MSVQGTWVRYGDNDAYSGYSAVPEGAAAGERPAVLLIQEIWGVDAHIQDVAGRFAEAGYSVLAPDLFFRDGARAPELSEERVAEAKRFRDSLPPAAQGDKAASDAKLAELPEPQRQAISETMKHVFAVPGQMAAYVEPLAAGVSYLRGAVGSTARPAPVAAVGYCMGGALAARLAARDGELRAAVVYYGDLPSGEHVPEIGCPVLGHFGELDKRITSQVPAFAEAMAQHGKRFDYRIYEGAPHAFNNDTRPSYRAEAAQEAWERTLSFLKETVN